MELDMKQKDKDIINRTLKLLDDNEETGYSLEKKGVLKSGTVVITQWKQYRAKPSTDALMQIADYFDVSVDYLMGRTENPRINL